uniref:Immunoglobulin V-set domain-containing protein n=1 Tax=Varanus komodoensis TaxID=61221 RepID=A0A8D2L5J2_VARKO
MESWSPAGHTATVLARRTWLLLEENHFPAKVFLDLFLTSTMLQPRKQGLFCKGLLLAAALLCSRAPPSRALARDVAVAAIPALPAEGQNVTLSVLNATGAIREVSWFRGRATDGGARIFSYFPGNSRPQRNGAQHTQRELGFPNGSMLIGALRPSDQQPYTVVILVRPKATFKGTVDLLNGRRAYPQQLLCLLSYLICCRLCLCCSCL